MRGAPLPLGINPDKRLREKRAEGIDGDIAHARFAQGYEGLVPFVQAGVSNGDEEGDNGPTESPTRAAGAESMKDGDTENPEFGDMGEFTNTDVHQMELVTIGRGKQPVQDRDNHASGLRTAKIVSGKNRN